MVLRDVEDVMLALVGTTGGGDVEGRRRDGEAPSEQEVEYSVLATLSPRLWMFCLPCAVQSTARFDSSVSRLV